MAIYKTPYDTTAGAGYRYANTASDLRAALVAGGLAVHEFRDEQDAYGLPGRGHYAQFQHQIALVQGGNSYADAVHFFKHPVLIQNDAMPCVCVDVREFGKWDAHQQRFAVRNISEYVLAIKRGILTALWANGERFNQLRDLSNLPAQTYAALLSESIQRRFALDPAEQATVAVLAAHFYYGLFTDEVDVDEDEKNPLAAKIAAITSVDANRVFQIIDQIPRRMASLSQLCANIRQQVGNIALENLNEGTLFGVVGGTWFGSNSRELLCMALEHPPSWVLVVNASLTSQTFKRATLSKISQRFDKRGAGDNFAKALTALLGGPNAVADLSVYADFFGSA